MQTLQREEHQAFHKNLRVNCRVYIGLLPHQIRSIGSEENKVSDTRLKMSIHDQVFQIRRIGSDPVYKVDPRDPRISHQNLTEDGWQACFDVLWSPTTKETNFSKLKNSNGLFVRVALRIPEVLLSLMDEVLRLKKQGKKDSTSVEDL
jgi:hypothetical protein